jgi:SAM-dependent methyltransferase
MMAGGAFDGLTDVFESSINWEKRLAHEEGFYRNCFAQWDAKTVLDAACGPGRHAGMFHRWGLMVEGADLSPNMIARAKANVPEDKTMRWVVRGYEDHVGGEFDAVICVGNSLALARSPDAAQRGVLRMAAAARRGMVVHVANGWAWPDGPCLWQRCARTPGRTLVRGVHRCGARGFVELIVLADGESGGEPTIMGESAALVLLEAGEIEHWMRQGGARSTRVYGGYKGEAYEKGKSVDIVVVGEK